MFTLYSLIHFLNTYQAFTLCQLHAGDEGVNKVLSREADKDVKSQEQRG